MSLLLGCIADDFTGATDLASMLVRQGMATVQLIGVPDSEVDVADAEAVVVALKSRTIPGRGGDRAVAGGAVLAAARRAPARSCSSIARPSTSTDQGNIGPVSEALLDALGADFTIACPAFPENGRSLYMGHLFVGERLLSDTHMRHHPLTPMTDSNLVAVLGRQSRAPVGLVPYAAVERGAEAIRARFAELRGAGMRQAIADATVDRHLVDLGAAAADLAADHRRLGHRHGSARQLPPRRDCWRSPVRPTGCRGSTGTRPCWPAVARRRRWSRSSASPRAGRFSRSIRWRWPAMAGEVERAIAWAEEHLAEGPLLIRSSAPPEEVARVQQAVGRERAGALVESAMAQIARALVERGVRRLVVAGGETSGAVVAALGVKALRIGAPIDPGVPWTVSLGEPHLALALKSGNFGAPDFFRKAFDCGPGSAS